MKIVVFGANGKTGIEVTKQALEAGHEVIAYVRRENAIDFQHSKLKIIVGLLNDESKISEAIAGADACISTLGGNSLRKPSTDFTNGIQLICKTMEELKVKRLIYLSSIGANESYYYMQRLVRFLVVDLMLRIPLADHSSNETHIRNTKLNYTIIRPGGLSDGPLNLKLSTGTEKIVFKGNPKISRASVASFILQQLTDARYVLQAVWLCEEK